MNKSAAIKASVGDPIGSVKVLMKMKNTQEATRRIELAVAAGILRIKFKYANIFYAY